MDFLIKFFLLAWVLILFKLASKNNNLKSLLLMIAIPKAIDLIALSFLLEPLKSSDDYRQWFYIVHSVNDLLMVLLLKYRCFFTSILSPKLLYRRLNVEKVISLLFIISIVLNVLVFSDFYAIGYKYYNLPESYFFYLHPKIQLGLLFPVELLILSYLTYQTIAAVKKLRVKGLID
jgi:hypothetical protein